jgi:two-component system, LytTR family, response regulator LytT
MHFIIVEDELLIAEMLKEMLTDLGHNIVSIAKNYDEFIKSLNQNPKVDCCFLDINLKQEKTGLNIAKLLKEQYQIPFIFITSYTEKTMIDSATALAPEAYIIKPFTEKDLYVNLQLFQLRKMATAKAASQVLIKDGSVHIKINIGDIIWIKAVQVYTEIKTTNKTYLVRNSLTGFLNEMQSNSIVRVHRSLAVNLQYVSAFTTNQIIVQGEKFPLSRTHKDEFFGKIK